MSCLNCLSQRSVGGGDQDKVKYLETLHFDPITGRLGVHEVRTGMMMMANRFVPLSNFSF